MVVRAATRDVVHHQRTGCTAVVRTCNGAETFLASRVLNSEIKRQSLRPIIAWLDNYRLVKITLSDAE